METGEPAATASEGQSRPLDLVDINEASRVTGLTPQTIYRLARQKRIRSFKVLRKRVRFDRGDLAELVEEHPRQASREDGG
jgi:excisionase family DNA binding protein